MMSWTYSTHASVSPTSPASMGSTSGRGGRNGRSEEAEEQAAAAVDDAGMSARPLLLACSEDLGCWLLPPPCCCCARDISAHLAGEGWGERGGNWMRRVRERETSE